MVKDVAPPIPVADLSARLPQLKKRHAYLLSEAARIGSEAAKIGALIAAIEAVETLNEAAEAGADALEQLTEARTPTPTQPPVTVPASASPYYGLGLGEAGKKFLSTIADKTPQTYRVIWEALHSTGYTISAKDPYATLSWQLRKREENHGDVILVGDGKFALTDWYTMEEQARIRKTRGKQPWRNHEEHSQRTKDGLRQAAQERGIRLGGHRKMTIEMLAQVREELLKPGAKVIAVAEQLGVSAASIYSHFSVRKRKGNLLIEEKTDMAREARAVGASVASVTPERVQEPEFTGWKN